MMEVYHSQSGVPCSNLHFQSLIEETLKMSSNMQVIAAYCYLELCKTENYIFLSAKRTYCYLQYLKYAD